MKTNIFALLLFILSSLIAFAEEEEIYEYEDTFSAACGPEFSLGLSEGVHHGNNNIYTGDVDSASSEDLNITAKVKFTLDGGACKRESRIKTHHARLKAQNQRIKNLEELLKLCQKFKGSLLLKNQCGELGPVNVIRSR